jgi:hypothetical protein
MEYWRIGVMARWSNGVMDFRKQSPFKSDLLQYSSTPVLQYSRKISPDNPVICGSYPAAYKYRFLRSDL